MATPTWQQILERGQQTLAVWQQHSPGFTTRGLTLAAHQTDVAALSPASQLVADAQDVVDDARAARDAVIGSVAETCIRLPRKLDGELMPDDPYHADLEDIRRFDAESLPTTVSRGQRVLSLWKKLNARNAAASPVIPPLLVGGVAVATFQTQLESLPAKQQTVQDKEAILRDRRGELRTLATKVDRNNKRWYAAWQGEFPAGTPEGDALGQITTEGGGSGEGTPGDPPPPPPPPVPPGAATIGSVTAGGPDVTVIGMAAEGAETFDVEVRPVGGDFAPQASGVAGPDFAFAAPAAGDYEVRIAGRNTAGLGPWSDPAAFTV